MYTILINTKPRIICRNYCYKKLIYLEINNKLTHIIMNSHKRYISQITYNIYLIKRLNIVFKYLKCIDTFLQQNRDRNTVNQFLYRKLR